MAIFLATIVAALTWLMLVMAAPALAVVAQASVAAGTFLLVSAALSAYMRVCMQRHCHHHEEAPAAGV